MTAKLREIQLVTWNRRSDEVKSVGIPEGMGNQSKCDSLFAIQSEGIE